MSIVDDVLRNLARHEQGRGRDELEHLERRGLVAEAPNRGRRRVHLTPQDRQIATGL